MLAGTDETKKIVSFRVSGAKRDRRRMGRKKREHNTVFKKSTGRTALFRKPNFLFTSYRPKNKADANALINHIIKSILLLPENPIWILDVHQE